MALDMQIEIDGIPALTPEMEEWFDGTATLTVEWDDPEEWEIKGAHISNGPVSVEMLSHILSYIGAGGGEDYIQEQVDEHHADWLHTHDADKDWEEGR